MICLPLDLWHVYVRPWRLRIMIVHVGISPKECRREVLLLRCRAWQAAFSADPCLSFLGSRSGRNRRRKTGILVQSHIFVGRDFQARSASWRLARTASARLCSSSLCHCSSGWPWVALSSSESSQCPDQSRHHRPADQTGQA